MSLGEIQYWKSIFGSIVKPRVPIHPYVPERRELPERVPGVFSAWRGIESILSDLIQRFDIGTGSCLEFGVERGYSTAALSSYFDSVIGVDTFLGDKHTGTIQDVYEDTKERLSVYKNIQLIRSDYRDWIARDETVYDLIHVDIIHSYRDTFACGRWSARHARCVLFHDTESFLEVKRAASDVARESGKSFYNFTEHYGLGILV